MWNISNFLYCDIFSIYTMLAKTNKKIPHKLQQLDKNIQWIHEINQRVFREIRFISCYLIGQNGHLICIKTSVSQSIYLEHTLVSGMLL